MALVKMWREQGGGGIASLPTGPEATWAPARRPAVWCWPSLPASGRESSDVAHDLDVLAELGGPDLAVVEARIDDPHRGRGPDRDG